MAVAQSEEVRINYDKNFDPRCYLEMYYLEVEGFEEFILRNLQLAFQSGKAKGGRLLDFGCGPVVHRSALASKYCNQVTFCDFSSRNRDFVQNWLKSDSEENLYSNLFQFVANLEGFEDPVEGSKIIVSRLKSKVAGVIQCDAHNASPLTPAQEPFDAIYSGGTLASCTESREHFVPVIRNVVSLLRPGGVLLYSGFTDYHYYHVGEVKFPGLAFDDDFVRESCEAAGLKILDYQTDKWDVAGEHDSQCKIGGCFFVTAQKPV